MEAKKETRPYRKRKRAEAEEETHRRITVAAVELHGTVGPANTTVTDLAKLAGVSRMTVYNHFPTDADLFRACSTHWATENPFPDPAAWMATTDPGHRVLVALEELYGWYGGVEQMLANVLRDAPIMPPVAKALDEIWWPYVESLHGALMTGWSIDTDRLESLGLALRVAIDFNTWRVLNGSGADSRRAASTMARMVTSSTRMDSELTHPVG